MPAPRRAPGPWFGGMVAVLGLVVLATIASWNACPYLPDGFTGEIVFPGGIAGRAEPLLCTGRYGTADFLVVTYVDEKTATFSYDSWGVGGPTSAPFTFEPGARRKIRVEMPSLPGRPPATPRELRPLVVRLNDREILSASVRFHGRAPHQVYFAENPVGGNTAWAIFRGRLANEDGRRLIGGHRTMFRWPDRLTYWLRTKWWEALLIGLVSVAAGFAARPVAARLAASVPRVHPARAFVASRPPPHMWFVASALLCTATFGTLVTNGTFTFIFADDYSGFYDYQARSLLAGRLDVPEEAIGGEAFVVNGRMYGYFGVTPALLRLPFVAANVAFGQLSRVYLLAYYIGCLIAGYALLVHAVRRLAPGGWPSPAATVLFTLSTGLGSSLFFLGARAYVYHEAILCGAVFALWAAYFALRYIAAPESRAWLGALVCGVLAIQARPSSGLFALCALGAAAGWVSLGRLRKRHVAASVSEWSETGPRPRSRPQMAELRRPLLIGALAAAGILSFNGMSYLKFKTFDGSPFRYSVQYTEERRAKFEGRNFHLANLPHNVDVYVLHPGFLLRPRFPYLLLYEDDRAAAPGARIDLEEPALGFPYAMPALFILAVLGGASAAWRAPILRPALGVLTLALAPMALALFTAVVTSHRYTADFCPFFIAAGAAGLAVWDAEPRLGWRRAFLAGLAVLTMISIAVTLALTLRFQGEMVWGVPEEGKQNYERLRHAVDGFFGTGRK